MNFAGKSLMVVALMTAGLAKAHEASPLFTSGSAVLTLSLNATSVLSAARASLKAPEVIPAVSNLPEAGGINSVSYWRPTAELTLNFSSMTTSGDAVSSLHTANSFLDINGIRFEDIGPPTGLSVYLTDFDLDLGNFTIYANLYARNRTTNEMVAFGKLPIFTASLPGIVGGTQGHFVDSMDGSGVRATGSLAGDLWMNPDTANIMLASLGAPTAASEPIAMVWRESSWGTLSFTASAVPEPATCALFGIGLLSMVVSRSFKPTAG